LGGFARDDGKIIEELGLVFAGSEPRGSRPDDPD
jgi:hypothetical protein